jgi:hypothetical protein
LSAIMAKKKHKSLLPKRIAGVKVPKAVRKGRFGELLASQTGQALIAEALLAAGAIGATKKAADTVTDQAQDSGRLQAFAERLRTQSAGGKDAAAAGAVLAVALGEAARAFVTALSEHQHRALPPEPVQAEPEGSKKKPSASLPH